MKKDLNPKDKVHAEEAPWVTIPLSRHCPFVSVAREVAGMTLWGRTEGVSSSPQQMIVSVPRSKTSSLGRHQSRKSKFLVFMILVMAVS